MENKVSDEGIKTSLPSSDDANRILSCPQTPGGRKVILQTAFKDHNPRTQSRQFHEHIYIFEYKILTVEIEKFAWCSGDGIFLPFGPSLCWINAPLHCPENEQPPQYKQQQNLHRSSHHRHVGRFSTHNPVINAVVQVSSSESV